MACLEGCRRKPLLSKKLHMNKPQVFWSRGLVYLGSFVSFGKKQVTFFKMKS